MTNPRAGTTHLLTSSSVPDVEPSAKQVKKGSSSDVEVVESKIKSHEANVIEVGSSSDVEAVEADVKPKIIKKNEAGRRHLFPD